MQLYSTNEKIYLQLRDITPYALHITLDAFLVFFFYSILNQFDAHLFHFTTLHINEASLLICNLPQTWCSINRRTSITINTSQTNRGIICYFQRKVSLHAYTSNTYTFPPVNIPNLYRVYNFDTIYNIQYNRPFLFLTHQFALNYIVIIRGILTTLYF